MKIGPIDLDEQVMVIAEIGNNHEGNYSLAEELIGLAARAGADAVKFQTIKPEKLINDAQGERLMQLKRFELSYEEFERLERVARQEGVLFLSTPFDIESVKFLSALVPAFKIASGDNNFYPLIKEVACCAKPVLLSTGLAELNEIALVKRYIEGIWSQKNIKQDMLVLHCVTAYPVEPGQANLLAIKTLRDELKCRVGYSDHTMGTQAAELSVALGARVIEKHFTKDKNYSDFRDHQLSADPREFAIMVERIRIADRLLGSGMKKVSGAERESLKRVRRTIVARHHLTKGKVLAWEDLNWTRPFNGLAPGQEEDLVGRRLKVDLAQGSAILLKDLT